MLSAVLSLSADREDESPEAVLSAVLSGGEDLPSSVVLSLSSDRLPVDWEDSSSSDFFLWGLPSIKRTMATRRVRATMMGFILVFSTIMCFPLLSSFVFL